MRRAFPWTAWKNCSPKLARETTRSLSGFPDAARMANKARQAPSSGYNAPRNFRHCAIARDMAQRSAIY